MAADLAPLTSPEDNVPGAKVISQPPGLEEAPHEGLESSPRLSPQDAVDFLLHPVEIAKGRTAAENYLGTCRGEESRQFAKEALEMLATVISGGRCDSLEFPWQQVRP